MEELKVTIKVPCVDLPPLGPIPKVSLPLGGTIAAFPDFSVGAPTDCTMLFNILVQIGPILGNLTCLLKLLNVLGKVKDVVGPPINPFKLGDLAKAIEDAMGCILAMVPPFPSIILAIKQILELIITYLKCFVDQLDHILQLLASIDLKAAEGNPALLSALQCAQSNAQNSMHNLMQSLQPLVPLLELIKTIGSIVGVNIDLTFDGMSDIKEAAQVVDQISAKIDAIKQIVDALPG